MGLPEDLSSFSLRFSTSDVDQCFLDIKWTKPVWIVTMGGSVIGPNGDPITVCCDSQTISLDLANASDVLGFLVLSKHKRKLEGGILRNLFMPGLAGANGGVTSNSGLGTTIKRRRGSPVGSVKYDFFTGYITSY